MTDNWIQTAANWAQILGVPIAIISWLVTKERFAKFWKRFGWLIFFALGVLAAYRFGWLRWLSERFALPLWTIILLFLSGPFLFGSLIGLVSLYQKTTAPHREYQQDEVFGVDWQWQYEGNHFDVFSFWGSCPNCRCRLTIRESMEGTILFSMDGTVLFCQHCGFSRTFPEQSLDNLKRSVAIEIERRIRTGEYRARIEKQALRRLADH